MIRKVGCLLGLILVVSLAAAAQDAPKAEVFGGYSYLRFNPGQGVSGDNLNGASGSFSYNPRPAVGIVADIGVYHTGDAFGSGLSVNSVSYLFGPKFVSRGRRAEPFVQALFGGVRISGSGVGTADNAFAMTLGGGVDVTVSPSVAIRAIQAEYVMTRFDVGTGSATSQHKARISAGIVIRFGEQ